MAGQAGYFHHLDESRERGSSTGTVTARQAETETRTLWKGFLVIEKRHHSTCIPTCSFNHPGWDGEPTPDPVSVCIDVIEGSLEVKLPTIWTDEAAEVGRGREEKES